MTRFVVYFRVRTDRQVRSGFDLEAQRAAVAGYVASGHGTIEAEFVGIESGRKKDRPQLTAALAASSGVI